MTKSDTSKYTDDERVSYVNVGLQNPSLPEVDVMSSDDETTSSSLMPIPETLRQMRCDLKRTISDMGEHSEAESADTRSTIGETATKVSNSLDELRKKYMLKNERSVNLKMNSANLMLDDILKSSSNSTDNFTPKFLMKQEEETKKIQETETSSGDESVCTVKHCNHAALLPSATPTLSPYELSVPFCPKHYKSFQPYYVSHEKRQPTPKEVQEENKKKRSLVEKLQNYPVGCKIQSVYRVMQNFYKMSKKPISTEKEVSSNNHPQNPDIIKEEEKHDYETSEYFPEEYHQRRMVFDLLENNGIYHKFNRNMEKQEVIIGGNEKCECEEIKDQCTCEKCSCSVTHIFEENHHQDKNIQCFQALKSENYQSETAVPPLPPESRNEFKGPKKHCFKERKLFERTDIYYFDHGNSAYYRTTDSHPMRYTECLVERTDEYATKFWAEFFGVIEVGIAFLISFILQFYRFCFTSIIRSLTVGLLQIFSDYFFKPLLTVAFNGLIQPCLILGYNIATSFRDLCLPISETFGFYVKEVANLFRACRLVEINRDSYRQSPGNCENKV